MKAYFSLLLRPKQAYFSGIQTKSQHISPKIIGYGAIFLPLAIIVAMRVFREFTPDYVASRIDISDDANGFLNVELLELDIFESLVSVQNDKINLRQDGRADFIVDVSPSREFVLAPFESAPSMSAQILEDSIPLDESLFLHIIYGDESSSNMDASGDTGGDGDGRMPPPAPPIELPAPPIEPPAPPIEPPAPPVEPPAPPIEPPAPPIEPPAPPIEPPVPPVEPPAPPVEPPVPPVEPPAPPVEPPAPPVEPPAPPVEPPAPPVEPPAPPVEPPAPPVEPPAPPVEPPAPPVEPPAPPVEPPAPPVEPPAPPVEPPAPPAPPVNSLPYVVSASSINVAENTPALESIYQLIVRDDDITDLLTLDLSDASRATFGFDFFTGDLWFLSSPNYEAQARYEVEFRIADGGDEISHQLEILIDNANDAATGAPAIIGSFVQGETLTAGIGSLVDADGLPSLSVPGGFVYEWLRDGEIVASGTSYALTQIDVGAQISLKVQFVDGAGVRETRFGDVSALISNAQFAPLGEVVVLGELAQYARVSADVSGLSDLDGLPRTSTGALDYEAFSFEWFGVNSNDASARIALGTGRELTLAQSAVGHYLSVRVSYIDGDNAPQIVETISADLVTNIADNPVLTSSLSLTISENLQLGDRFIIYRARAEDIDGDALSYHLVDNAAHYQIDSASGVVYLTSALDFEAQDDASFTIQVMSDAPQEAPVEATISVTIIDTNDRGFIRAQNSAGAEGEVSQISLSDVQQAHDSASERGTASIIFDAEYVDQDNGGDVQFSIAPADQHLFGIDASTGEVWFRQAVAYETTPELNLTILATDSHLATSHVVVHDVQIALVDAIGVVAGALAITASDTITVGTELRFDTSGVERANDIDSLQISWIRHYDDGRASESISSDASYWITPDDIGTSIAVHARAYDEQGDEIFVLSDNPSVQISDGYSPLFDAVVFPYIVDTDLDFDASLNNIDALNDNVVTLVDSERLDLFIGGLGDDEISAHVSNSTHVNYYVYRYISTYQDRDPHDTLDATRDINPLDGSDIYRNFIFGTDQLLFTAMVERGAPAHLAGEDFFNALDDARFDVYVSDTGVFSGTFSFMFDSPDPVRIAAGNTQNATLTFDLSASVLSTALLNNADALARYDTAIIDSTHTAYSVSSWSDVEALFGAGNIRFPTYHDVGVAVTSQHYQYIDNQYYYDINPIDTLDNFEAVGSVEITNNAQLGYELHVQTNIYDNELMGVMRYQWQWRDGDGDWQNINNQTDATYRVTELIDGNVAAHGKSVRVGVEYTDSQNIVERFVSGEHVLSAYDVPQNYNDNLIILEGDIASDDTRLDADGINHAAIILGTMADNAIDVATSGEKDFFIVGGGGRDVITLHGDSSKSEKIAYRFDSRNYHGLDGGTAENREVIHNFKLGLDRLVFLDEANHADTQNTSMAAFFENVQVMLVRENLTSAPFYNYSLDFRFANDAVLRVDFDDYSSAIWRTFAERDYFFDAITSIPPRTSQFKSHDTFIFAIGDLLGDDYPTHELANLFDVVPVDFVDSLLDTHVRGIFDRSSSIEGIFDIGSTVSGQIELATADSLTSIEWLRDGVVIDGASDFEYQITADDIGSALALQASYSDQSGFSRTVVSESAPVSELTDARSLVHGNQEASTRNLDAVIFGSDVGVYYLANGGDDTLTASSGSDVLTGGLGIDSYELGAGNRNMTTLLFNLNEDFASSELLGLHGREIIDNFRAGEDRLWFVDSAGGRPSTIAGGHSPTTAGGRSPTAFFDAIDAHISFEHIVGTPVQWQVVLELPEQDSLQINVSSQRLDTLASDPALAPFVFNGVSASDETNLFDINSWDALTQIFGGTEYIKLIDGSDAPMVEIISASAVVDGVAQVGYVLTASLSTPDSDPAPAMVEHRWLRSGRIIEGADSAEYRLTSDDAGHSIRHIIRYSDGDGAPVNTVSNTVSQSLKAFLVESDYTALAVGGTNGDDILTAPQNAVLHDIQYLIRGGAGDDIIDARSGDHLIIGGAGDDMINIADSSPRSVDARVSHVVYRFAADSLADGDGIDNVAGFRLNEDRLTLAGHEGAMPALADIYLIRVGDQINVIFEFDSDDVLTVALTAEDSAFWSRILDAPADSANYYIRLQSLTDSTNAQTSEQYQFNGFTGLINFFGGGDNLAFIGGDDFGFINEL